MRPSLDRLVHLARTYMRAARTERRLGGAGDLTELQAWGCLAQARKLKGVASARVRNGNRRWVWGHLVTLLLLTACNSPVAPLMPKVRLWSDRPIAGEPFTATAIAHGAGSQDWRLAFGLAIHGPAGDSIGFVEQVLHYAYPSDSVTAQFDFRDATRTFYRLSVSAPGFRTDSIVWDLR